jgi:HSP20 family protein
MAQKHAKAAKLSERPTAPAPARVPVRHLGPAWRWERDLDRWLDDFRHRLPWPRLWEWPLAGAALKLPALDVYEKGNEVVVRAELPGMTRDDIEVNLTDTTVTIKGEKRQEEEVKDEEYYRCERSFGSFARTVDLPAEVKTEGATATFKDGVLEVRLPKSAAAKPKAVKVDVQ